MLALQTPDQAAQKLNVTIRTLARWRTDGCGPRFVRVGKRRIGYTEAEIDRWLADHTHASLASEAARAADAARAAEVA